MPDDRAFLFCALLVEHRDDRLTSGRIDTRSCATDSKMTSAALTLTAAGSESKVCSEIHCASCSVIPVFAAAVVIISPVMNLSKMPL